MLYNLIASVWLGTKMGGDEKMPGWLANNSFLFLCFVLVLFTVCVCLFVCWAHDLNSIDDNTCDEICHEICHEICDEICDKIRDNKYVTKYVTNYVTNSLTKSVTNCVTNSVTKSARVCDKSCDEISDKQWTTTVDNNSGTTQSTTLFVAVVCRCLYCKLQGN